MENSRLIVQNLPRDLTESALKARFAEAGRVTDCRIMFRGDRPRGFAFVGFRAAAGAAKAISQFDNTFIGSRRVKVKYALLRGDKGLRARAGARVQAKPEEPRADALRNRLFVKNFPFDTSEEELRKAFEAFGSVDECRIIRDSAQRSRGFGFVGFAENVSAAKAFDALHNTSGLTSGLRQDSAPFLRKRTDAQPLPEAGARGREGRRGEALVPEGEEGGAAGEALRLRKLELAVPEPERGARQNGRQVRTAEERRARQTRAGRRRAPGALRNGGAPGGARRPAGAGRRPARLRARHAPEPAQRHRAPGEEPAAGRHQVG